MTKRRPKGKALPARHGETATKERRTQNGGVISEVVDRDITGKANIKRQRAYAECVLDYYLCRDKITPLEHEAAMKFRRAYLRSVLRVKIDDGGPGSHGDPEMATLIVVESQRVLTAAYTVLSSAQQVIISKTCGHDEWVGDSYRFETFHRALAKLIALWHIG